LSFKWDRIFGVTGEILNDEVRAPKRQIPSFWRDNLSGKRTGESSKFASFVLFIFKWKGAK
jgi:hypothetical protein